MRWGTWGWVAAVVAVELGGCGSERDTASAVTAGPSAASTGASAGQGGQGGGGGTTTCDPGTTMDCYEGPAGTEGMGSCIGGVSTCNADGTDWGPCEGQVLPSIDDCMTPADEDCDGTAQPCPTGAPLWSARFGDGAAQDALCVAIDAAGNGIIGGFFEGSFSFGGPTLSGTGDAFLVKLDPAGTHVWTKQFGGPATQEIRKVRVAPNGDIVVAGVFVEQIDLGGGPVTTSQSYSNIFVGRLDASGNHLWTKGAGDPSYPDSLDALAVDSAGNVIVCGNYQGAIDFGGIPLVSTTDSSVFVAKLDPSGTALWAKSLGGPNGEGCAELVTDAMNNVIVAGTFVGPADIGNGLISGGGNADVFVTRFDPAGATLFALPFGDMSAQGATDAAVDASGNVFVAGKFYGAIDFGGGPLSNETIFVAKLTSAGAHIASSAYAPAGNLNGGVRLAVDPFGNLALAGEFMGSMDLGGGVLPWTGSSNDMFFAKLGPSLGHWWSRSAGAGGFTSEDCRDIASDGEGNVWVVGRFENSVDFGTGALTGAGNVDIFVAKYAY